MSRLIDEYDQITQIEIKKCESQRYTCNRYEIFWLVAGATAFFLFDAPIISGILVLIAIVFRQGAIEAQLKINMFEANWCLAVLISQCSGDYEDYSRGETKEDDCGTGQVTA